MLFRTTEDLYYRKVYTYKGSHYSDYQQVLYKRTVIWLFGFIPLYVKHKVA